MRHRIKIAGLNASDRLGRSAIQTTLYQLIEAVSEVLPSGDDAVVALIVNDILNRSVVGKAK